MTATAFAHPAEPWAEADLDALPRDGNRYEIIDGRLIVTPPASDFHGETQGCIFMALRDVCPDGFHVVVECGIRIPGGNVIADVGVLTPMARRGVIWREARDVALVVEVASPATGQYDATDKQAAYARAGIASYWRVGQDGTTHVLALDGGSYRDVHEVAPGDEWESTEPFPVTLRPADWR